MTTLTEGAFAKINLTLDVLDRREDGYHDIRTHDVSLAVHDICSGIGGNIRNEVLVEIALRIRRDIVIGHALFLQNLVSSCSRLSPESVPTPMRLMFRSLKS
mgnify:CR=1 FL=1